MVGSVALGIGPVSLAIGAFPLGIGAPVRGVELLGERLQDLPDSP